MVKSKIYQTPEFPLGGFFMAEGFFDNVSGSELTKLNCSLLRLYLPRVIQSLDLKGAIYPVDAPGRKCSVNAARSSHAQVHITWRMVSMKRSMVEPEVRGLDLPK